MDDYWNEAKCLSELARNSYAVPSSEEADKKRNRQQKYPPQVDQEQLQTVHWQNLTAYRRFPQSVEIRSALVSEELPRVGLHGWELT